MKKILLVLLSLVMCFGFVGCTKNLTADEIKAKLEKKDYAVAAIKIGSYAAINGTNGSENISVIVCDTKDEAIKCQEDLEKIDILALITYKQAGKYVYSGTEAGIKVFERII